MTTIAHTPEINCKNRYTIYGTDINDIVEFSIPRIKAISQDFYRREIKNDLAESGKSLIDSHAGMGSFYIIELITEDNIKAWEEQNADDLRLYELERKG